MIAFRSEEEKVIRPVAVGSRYERMGEKLVKQLSEAAKKERWGSNILKLAWTAGPVTYLALQGGYVIGFGHSAPPNLFIYFAMYTAITGIIALAFRWLYQATRGKIVEEAREKLSRVMTILPDLVILARDRGLAAYDAEGRKTLAAMYILSNTDASENAVLSAVEDLTGDQSLVTAARRIEVFRKNGMLSRINDVHAKVDDQVEKIAEEVELKSPVLAELFRKRFRGRVPSKRTGKARTEGFIERILSSGEESEFDLMSMKDVEEMFTLAFELIADRKIPLLSIRYLGSTIFTQVSENLDRARRNYRTVAFVRNSRLRMLAEHFSDFEEVQRLAAANPNFKSINELSENIQKALNHLAADIEKMKSRKLFSRRLGDEERREAVGRFRTALGLYKLYREANDECIRKYHELASASNRYQETRKKYAKEFSPNLLFKKEKGKGIEIEEREIYLPDRVKTQFSSELADMLEHIYLRKRYFGAYYIEDNREARVMDDEDYKVLAFEVARLLDKHIKISKPEVQQAIESSNAPNLSALEFGLTSMNKVGWGVALVNELEKSIKKPIYRIVKVLVNYHGFALTEETLDYLELRFDADPEVLQRIIPDEPAAPSLPKLLEVPALDRRYTSLLSERN